MSVEPKTRRGRPNSEGGFGTVTKKKRRKQDGSIAATPDTAASDTSGISLYDVRYTLDGRLSTEVERSRVNIAMLSTTARRRNGEDSVGPSLLSRRMMSATLPRRQSENIVAAARPTLTKYSTEWLL